MLNKILNASTLPPAANQNSSINRTRRYTREQKNSIGNTTTANQLVDKKIKNIENLNNELHIGITTGLEIKKIEELLKQGSDPNGFIPHLKTYPMKDAIEHGKLEIVKLLLDYNADIHGNSEVLNSINPYTNLSYATYKNNYDIVEFLLEKNADPNYEIKKHCSQSLLCEAVCNNNIEIVKLLIDHGAKIDGLEYFRSPLYFSIKHNQDTKVMQLLLEHSVNPNYGSVYKKLWKDAILCDNISALPLLLII